MDFLYTLFIKIFSNFLMIFAGISGVRTCNPRDNYMHFTGYILRHGDPPHFLWGENLQCRSNGKTISHLQMDIFCHFDFSHNRWNDIKDEHQNVKIFKNLSPNEILVKHIYVYCEAVPSEISMLTCRRKKGLSKNP